MIGCIRLMRKIMSMMLSVICSIFMVRLTPIEVKFNNKLDQWRAWNSF